MSPHQSSTDDNKMTQSFEENWENCFQRKRERKHLSRVLPHYKKDTFVMLQVLFYCQDVPCRFLGLGLFCHSVDMWV